MAEEYAAVRMLISSIMTRVKFNLGLLLTVLVLVSCHQEKEKQEPTVAKPVQPQPLVQTNTLAGLVYFEAVRGDAKKDELLPLVVSLHGRGDRPDENQFLDFGFPVRVVWPQAPMPFDSGFQWFQFKVMNEPTPTLAQDMEKAADQVAKFIKEYVKTRPTKGLPTVVGFSQGGMLCFTLAVKYPGAVSAVHPIAGDLPNGLLPSPKLSTDKNAKLVLPPVHAIHGVNDFVVPIDSTRMTMKKLEAAGHSVSFHEFESAGHELNAKMGEVLVEELVQSVRTASK